MKILSVSIPARVVPKQSTKFGKYGCYLPQRNKDFHNYIVALLRSANKSGKRHDGAILVQIMIYFKRPKSNKNPYPTGRPDLDNCQKAIFDAIKETVLVDDANITDAFACKRWGPVDKIDVAIFKHGGENA